MKRIGVSVLAVLFLLSADHSARAGEGGYMGLGIPFVQVEGNFDGNSGFVGANEVILVPAVDGALGLEFFGGYRGPSGVGAELNLAYTKHDAEWLGLDLEVKNLSVGVIFKYFLAPSWESVQPYLEGGLAYQQLEVIDGALSLSETGDAVYTGHGLTLGLGMDYFTHPHFSLGGGIKYRIVRYDEAEGIHESGELEDDLKGNGWTVFVRASYHFSDYTASHDRSGRF